MGRSINSKMFLYWQIKQCNLDRRIDQQKFLSATYDEGSSPVALVACYYSQEPTDNFEPF